MFDKLAHKISMSYQDKGMSVSEAKTAAVIGRRQEVRPDGGKGR